MSEAAPQPARNPRAVFVVHGRDHDARDAMYEFLRALDLRPMTWDEAVRLTGEGSPYIGEVLRHALAYCQAVVVLNTPDEVAYLRPELGVPSRDQEGTPSYQPRANVIFEAGMAMALDRTRTILVHSGDIRPMSDVNGLHFVRIDDSVDARRSLALRLETAGCPVDTEADFWRTAGVFARTGDPDLPLGRRLPSQRSTPEPPRRFRLSHSKRRNAMSKLRVTNSGDVDVYDVTFDAPEEASLLLRQQAPVPKIPAGASVTLDVVNHWGALSSGGHDLMAFDVSVRCRDADGNEIKETVFLDTNG